MEHHCHSQPNVTAKSGTLPIWVRWLFRFYGVYIPLLLISASTYLVYSLIIRNQRLLSEFERQPLELDTVVIYSLLIYGALLSLFLIFFTHGTLNCRRWVIPLVLIYSSYTTVVTPIHFFTHPIENTVILVFSMFNLGLALLLNYIALQYWSVFFGSTRKLLLQIPLILILLPHLVFFFLFALFPDDRTIIDQDLLLQPVSLLASEDNAHYIIPDIETTPEDTQENVRDAIQLIRDGNIIDVTDPLVQSLIEETIELTDGFLTATRRAGYQCPTRVNNYSYETELCNLGNIRTLAHLTSLRALVETETLNVDEALQTVTSIIRFSTHLTRPDQPQVLEYLVGKSIKLVAINTLEQILAIENKASNATLTELTNTLKQAEVPDPTPTNLFKHDYMQIKHTWQEAYAEYSNYFYQHNKTMNKFAQFMRYHIVATAKPCGVDTSTEEAALATMISDAISKQNISYATPNAIGNMLFSVRAAALSNLWETCEINEQNQKIRLQLENKLSL